MKHIEGLNERYSITNDGRVFSHVSKRWLKQSLSNSGYYCVHLRHEGKNLCRFVHCLVAAAYIGERPEGHYVCHNNNDKLDNRVENLRYDTPSNNQEDRKAHGTAYENKGVKNGSTKLTESQVLEIRELYATGRFSQREIGRAYGIRGDSVCRIVNRQLWSHI